MVKRFTLTIHTSHSRNQGRLRFRGEAIGATDAVGSKLIRRSRFVSANMAEKLLSDGIWNANLKLGNRNQFMLK
ncbi:hypothetical protein VNO77_16510 [Canavalia gladiata]|uniref:Uncharacterized protein n=1 Tax=Canavalia gladiata TaxID=3824 RepID=A0AAN9M0I2_CANGL